MMGALPMGKRSLILGGIAVFVWSGTALAAVWEELFSIAKDNVEVKIELKNSSFKQRLVRGEKIINAHIRTFYREGRERTVATRRLRGALCCAYRLPGEPELRGDCG